MDAPRPLPIEVSPGVAASLRIAMVTETYPPEVNGVAMTIGRLVTGMVSRMHHVMVVRPRQRPADARPVCEPRLETSIHAGMPIPGYRGLQFGLPARGHLLRRWSEWKPQVAYIATEGPLGWSALRAARTLGIAALTGFHTNFHSYSSHYGFGLLRPAIQAYLRAFHNRSACTLVATDALRRELYGAGFERIELLPRGVDTELYGPHRRSAAVRARWGLQEDELAVLYVGRMAPEKNLHLAVDAFRTLQRECPSACFVLVGDGPLRERLAREHPDFVFCGTHVGSSLAAHYASADLFLFPSLTETFGNVTLEAMASALPVVAFDYAAAHAHIRHGGNGLLAAYEDAAAFCACAVEAVQDIARLRRLGAQARETMQGVSWDAIYGRFEQLLLAHAQVGAA